MESQKQNKLKETNQQRFGRMFRKMQQGDAKVNKKINNAILLLGDSGTGKTSSSYLLSGLHLTGVRQQGQIVYKYVQKYMDAQIGHTRNSCTQIPNSFQTQDALLIDCPGAKDSFKFDRYISNAYYIYRVFSNAQNLKFILVCNQAALTTGRSRDFVDSILGFLELFNFDQNLSAKDLAKSTVLLFTKADNQFDNTAITEMIEMLIETPPEEQRVQEIYLDFLTGLKQNESYFIIRYAEDGKTVEYSQMLKQIKNKTTYWKRPIVDDVVCMKNVHFQINKKNMLKTQFQLAQKAFQICNQTIQNSAKLIVQAMKEVESKIFIEDPKYEFFNSFDQLMKNQYSFSGQKYNYEYTDRQLNSYFKQIKLLQKLYHYIPTHENNDNVASPQVISKSAMLNILESFVKYIIMSSEQETIISQFAFLLKRKFQEISILTAISSDIGVLNRHSIDILVGFGEKSWNQVEQNFALEYQLLKNKPYQYYQETIEFISKFKDRNDKILSKMIDAEVIKGNFSKGQDKDKALKSYLEAFKQSMELNKKVNVENFTKVNKQLCNRIGTILFEQGDYVNALHFFKVINNFQMVGECMDKLMEFEQCNKFTNRLEKGDYFRDLLLFEEAKKAYHEAHIVADEDKGEFQVASERILEIQTKKDEFVKNYEIKKNNKDRFKRLPAELNFDKLVEQMIKFKK